MAIPSLWLVPYQIGFKACIIVYLAMKKFVDILSALFFIQTKGLISEHSMLWYLPLKWDLWDFTPPLFDVLLRHCISVFVGSKQCDFHCLLHILLGLAACLVGYFFCWLLGSNKLHLRRGFVCEGWAWLVHAPWLLAHRFTDEILCLLLSMGRWSCISFVYWSFCSFRVLMVKDVLHGIEVFGNR